MFAFDLSLTGVSRSFVIVQPKVTYVRNGAYRRGGYLQLTLPSGHCSIDLDASRLRMRRSQTSVILLRPLLFKENL